ncbi:MAG: phosphatidylserine decarboxylase [Lachnospiraceae bacterium]|nr:phosphatidylserine decarboxylase [Lachnospiraceae bacterium]
MELEKSGRQCEHAMSGQDALISWLYGHAAGRMLLRPLVSPWFSRAGGWLLNTRLSALAVQPYVRANQIDLSVCKKQEFRSFNDFFTRELIPGARPVDGRPEAWISPCDARLTVFPISREGSFAVKHTPYTVESLLDGSDLAEHYIGGTLWMYRLCVDDYHRYIYPADGVKSSNLHIPGVFHTVNPIAGEAEPIYKKNTREYCVIRTENFGTILMMEVGAMLVGRIENREPSSAKVRRGQEKGNFAFGGSTILILSQPGRIAPSEAIMQNSRAGIETRVRMGEAVGYAYGKEGGR